MAGGPKLLFETVSADGNRVFDPGGTKAEITAKGDVNLVLTVVVLTSVKALRDWSTSDPVEKHFEHYPEKYKGHGIKSYHETTEKHGTRETYRKSPPKKASNKRMVQVSPLKRRYVNTRKRKSTSPQTLIMSCALVKLTRQR